MAKLTTEVQTLIVQELACFRTPSEVAEIVKETFGVALDRRQVQMYDAERAGAKPSKKWITLFTETRAAFREGRERLAIAHRTWRLRELMDMARAAKKAKNYKLAADIIKQAAEEDGDVFVNHRAKEPLAATEEEKIARMRAAIVGMDTMTAGDPLTGPSLTIAHGGAAA